MIKVFLVEQQRLVRDALQVIINEQDVFEVIGTAGDIDETIEQLPKVSPDLVLMPFQLTKEDGVQTIKAIKEMHPDIRVILLTEDPEEDNLIKALLNGADSILIREVHPDTLVSAIRNTHDGLTILSEEIANVLRKDISTLFIDKRKILKETLEKEGITLTPRVFDVAELFRYGLSNSQIAERLSLSEGTIKNYISEIYQSLGIHNREKAVNFLYEKLKDINDNYL